MRRVTCPNCDTSWTCGRPAATGSEGSNDGGSDVPCRRRLNDETGSLPESRQGIRLSRARKAERGACTTSHLTQLGDLLNLGPAGGYWLCRTGTLSVKHGSSFTEKPT